MSADMKTLREALRWACPPDNEARLLESALDELEALRGQGAYVASLDAENQRLRAESAERGLDQARAALSMAESAQAGVLAERDVLQAQRDELLAALVKARDFVASYCPNDRWLEHELNAAIAKARGGK